MTQYAIPLLLFSILSIANASNGETKNQFTVTHIMLDLLQNQENDDIFSDIPKNDENRTIYPGGEQR